MSLLLCLFFVRSGWVDNSSTLYNPGNNAYYWSRSSYSDSTKARSFNFNNANVNPSNNGGRYYGDSVRCLYLPVWCPIPWFAEKPLAKSGRLFGYAIMLLWVKLLTGLPQSSTRSSSNFAKVPTRRS